MHQPPVRFTYRLLSYLISTIIAGQPLLLAVGAVITPQNGAGMDKAANGVPVVNIATPNGAGISHNRFTDYNVGKEGLILNNATGKLNPTQLGGLIQNNPNLKAGGEAKGIINEVTGGNRSLLQGYTEVAGKAANVMVANPYGITCDGCGFINTPHATLTTGKPVMNADGSLQALEVTEGSITINGAGLDGTRSDAVSIIARATEVNAALHAKDLTVTAGANRITADGRVSALKGEGNVPKVAVDTGALGGMYARRIHLTSTESGVGVNLGNLYARDGDITLDASGRLTVNNSLATGTVTAKGQGVTLTGDHKAGGNLSVSSRSDIVLSNGTLNSDKDLSLTAGGRITQQNEKLTAGRDVTLAAKNITQDTASQINAARDIVTDASDTLTTQGQITAGQNLTASATTLTQDGILLAKGHAGLDAGTLNNSGAVQGASLMLGSTTLSNSGSLLSGSRLTVNTHEFNQSGRTGAKGKVDITASGKLTSTGLLVSDDALVLKAQDVTQNGVLSGGKGLTVSAQTLSSGKKSVTHSDAAMTLNVTTVALDGETSAGDTLRVQADKLSTAAGAQLQSGKNLSINARDARLAGTQAAQQTMVVNASEKLTHSGKSSAPSLSLSAPELTSSGVLVGSALNTQSQTLTNSGLLQGEASLTVNTQRLDNQQNGTLYSAADLTLDIPDIRNSGLITGDTGPLAAVRATDSLFMGAAGDISITGAAVSAGDSVLLSAGNDLNMNAIQAGERRRYGGSGWYVTHAVAPTVTAGNSLMLSAGRDVNSQAAGITAENSMDIRAGRDVNMAAESTGAGDHDSTFSMKTVHDSVRQQGTDMTSGGDITVTAGRDITSVATAVTAKGDIRVNAGHDIVLGTATESDYHYSESGETRNRLLSHQTTRTITEDSVTREKGSLLSGNRVTVNAGNNLTVQGSDVVADRDVSLAADNHVDVLAATSTDTSWRFKETKKSGLTGTGGIGFTTGSSKTTHDRREAGTTQSQSASTIGSTAGNVSITAGKQAHISGSDVIANRDISITGDSVVVDPGHDRRTVDEKFEQKKSGLTVALSGAVGSAINNAATMAREAKETSDSRLAALKGTQAVLSGVQAGVNHGLQQQSADPNNGIGVSISLNHQQSKSETKYQHDIVSGSTLSAGNNVSVTATGKNKDHNNSGDILITGSQIKSGNDTSLNAQNDILLAAAADTRQTTGKNSSKGGGVGVSFGGGTNGGGLSIFAGINGSEGREKGNGTTWTETTLDAGKNVSLTSGRDTTLSGAQVSGEKVTADVGNNLTISSLQDSDRYDSRQNSVAVGGSFTFGSMSGSGYASISQDKIKSNYDSVREQSGIYAGKDGFDVTVGNHTQLNGAVIASTATDDKNSLNTNTLGWSDIHNQADYKASHTGISLSGGSGMSASQMVASNAIAGAANALTGMSGSSGHAEGTTSSAISGGNLIIRDNESQKQDIAGLSRDPENANGSIAPIFDKEKEQKRLQEAQVISQISGQMSNIVMTYGETEAMKAARKEHPGMSDAQLRETPEYREVMKGYGTGSTPQMVVQAITGVLGGLNAGNPGQVLAGGLNPAVAQLIKQATGDNREANLMAHAVWGALAAQLGGNNAASGAAGAFSGELAARYIIDNYYGGRTDSLSEQERQQISMLATIASGIAGGLAGNSTTSAGTGAQAGRNSAENNMLNVIATETAANTAAAIAGATGNASKDTGNDNSWDTGGGCEGSREQCAVRDPSRDGARGPGHVLNGDNTDENKQPNLGKDVASATDKEKAELGGAGAGTPGGWEPQDEENARNNESIEQRNEKTSSENVPNSSEKLPWDSWQNYRKVTVDGRQYAQIGHRLYSQHAVDRMQPSGLGSPAGTVGPGRNITPNMVESVIKEGTPQNSVVNGVTRTTYWSGDVGVVTENNSNIIVTILRRSGQ